MGKPSRRRLRRRLTAILARLDRARRAFPENGSLPFTRVETEQLSDVLKGQVTEFGLVIFVGLEEVAILERSVARLEAAIVERNRTPSGN